MKHVVILILFSTMLTACTWVKLTPEGEKARVLSPTEVHRCKKLGTTTVSVKATILGFERNKKTIGKELETLARNRAMDLKGDTVVPQTKIEKGQRTYIIYRCTNP